MGRCRWWLCWCRGVTDDGRLACGTLLGARYGLGVRDEEGERDEVDVSSDLVGLSWWLWRLESRDGLTIVG